MLTMEFERLQESYNVLIEKFPDHLMDLHGCKTEDCLEKTILPILLENAFRAEFLYEEEALWEPYGF